MKFSTNIGLYVCLLVALVMYFTYFSYKFRVALFSGAKRVWKYLYGNKIVLAFLVVFIVFTVQVVQMNESLKKMANSMNNWDVALEE